MPRLKIDLDHLAANGRPGLTQSEAGHLVEAAAIAAEAGGTPIPLDMVFTGIKSCKPRVTGPTVTDQMRRCYADLDEAVEWGACSIATVAMEVLQGLTVWERSPKSGFGFDYYLAPLNQEDDAAHANFFAEATHVLEVSGTLQDDATEMDRRVKEKLRRLKRRPQILPAIVVVVDFRRVRAKAVKHG